MEDCRSNATRNGCSRRKYNFGNFLYDLVNKSQNFTLLYFYWLNLILKNTDETIKTASEIDQNILKSLTDMLIRNFCDCAYYDTDIGAEHDLALRKNLPLPLYIGNLSFLNERLKTVIKDKNDLVRLQAYSALKLWNEGNRANGLSSIATGCEYWLSLSSEEAQSSVGADVLMCLASIIEEVTAQNLIPAHEFLQIMCDKLHEHSNAVVLPYLYYTYLANVQTNENTDRRKMLLEKYPFINSLRDSKFESISVSKNMELNEKRSHFCDLIQHRSVSNLSHNAQSIKKLKNEEVPSKKYAFPISEKIQRELLDIELLQYMQNAEYSRATQSLISSAEQNVVASEVVTMLLVKNMYDQNKLQDLQKIRKSMPELSDVANNIFKLEIKLSMKNIYTLWKESRREIALEEALIQYQDILMNQNVLRDEIFQSVLSSVLRYIRLFVEELCYDEKNSALNNVEKHAIIGWETHGQIGLFLIQWETLFFSHKYSHHILADELLMRNPEIAKKINFDNALKKAITYQQEHFLSELFNISLQLDLKKETKSKILSALLLFYCEASNNYAAKKCMNISKTLEIPIPVETKQIFETLQKNNGFITRVLKYFKHIQRS